MQSTAASKRRRYLELNQKYLLEAEKLLDESDFVQASEKYWAAAIEIVKAYAAENGKILRIHRELRDYIRKLGNKHPKLELMSLFVDAEALHANFYEDELSPEGVEKYSKSVKAFNLRMHGLLLEDKEESPR